MDNSEEKLNLSIGTINGAGCHADKIPKRKCYLKNIQKIESSDFKFLIGAKKESIEKSKDEILWFQCFPASPRRLERPTYRLGVAPSTHKQLPSNVI